MGPIELFGLTRDARGATRALMRTNVVWLGALLLLACGGGAGEGETTEPTETAGTAGSEEAVAPEGEREWPAWADMDDEMRGQYMAEVVVPRMNEMFAEASQTTDELPSSVQCTTCHGENAREVGFHMPNTLHPLNPAEIPAMFESEDPETQAVAQFMVEVEHSMADMLGESPYDPETGEGFGCMGCHATAE